MLGRRKLAHYRDNKNSNYDFARNRRHMRAQHTSILPLDNSLNLPFVAEEICAAQWKRVEFPHSPVVTLLCTYIHAHAYRALGSPCVQARNRRVHIYCLIYL